MYDYHVGIAEAPTTMQEGLDPGPEEDEIQPAEKPYKELAHTTMKQIENIQERSDIVPINNGPYRNALVQMSRLPSATRPIAFTFELDKMIEFAHPMFVMMIADQVSRRNQFSEGELVDEIGTYTWLNAIITPIARTLAWMFEGVMPKRYDDYTTRIINEQGDMQGSWKGLTPTRAGQVQYWVNLIDQAILCKEEALQRAQGDKEA